MAKYLNKEALINKLYMSQTAPETIELIEDFPSSDAVEVVRCKDCERAQHKMFSEIWCFGRRISEEFYCAWGVRDE